jgi:hypothetical protein
MKDLIKEKQKQKRKKQLEQRKELQKWFDGFREDFVGWISTSK